jgi:hypothetical protein
MIAATTDKDTLDRLHNIHRSLINNPTQIKILSSVKVLASCFLCALQRSTHMSVGFFGQPRL